MIWDWDCPNYQLGCRRPLALTANGTVWRAQACNTMEFCQTEGMIILTVMLLWWPGVRCRSQCFSEHSEAGSGEENSAGAALPLRVTAVLSSICSSVQCQYDNTADIMAHNYTQHLSAAPRRAGSGAGAGRWADNDDTRTLDTQTLLWHDCRWHYYGHLALI